MAAAVADYTPGAAARPGRSKRPTARSTLTLVRTPDILAELGRARGGAGTPVLVGFAAESGDPVARGRAKLARKAVDLIVANDVSREGRRLRRRPQRRDAISRDGEEVLPPGPKTALAAMILDRAERARRRSRTDRTAVDPRELAQHLRFYQELGVTGISRDPKWRRRRPVTPESGRPNGGYADGTERGSARLPPEPRSARPATAAESIPPARSLAGRGACGDSRRTSATARAASCTRSGGSRSCSASATRRPTSCSSARRPAATKTCRAFRSSAAPVSC